MTTICLIRIHLKSKPPGHKPGRKIPGKYTKQKRRMNDYEWLTEMNLCHKCRKERPAPGKKFCFDCLDKIREENARRYNPEKAKEYQTRRRELYEEHKKNGICIRCRKPATHGVYCYECSIKAKRHSAAMSEKRKRERHERGLIPEKRKAEGKCLWCGKPAVPGMQCCAEHRKIFAAAGEKGYKQNLINKSNPLINEAENWRKK